MLMYSLVTAELFVSSTSPTLPTTPYYIYILCLEHMISQKRLLIKMEEHGTASRTFDGVP